MVSSHTVIMVSSHTLHSYFSLTQRGEGNNPLYDGKFGLLLIHYTLNKRFHKNNYGLGFGT